MWYLILEVSFKYTFQRESVVIQHAICCGSRHRYPAWHYKFLSLKCVHNLKTDSLLNSLPFFIIFFYFFLFFWGGGGEEEYLTLELDHSHLTENPIYC